MLTLKSVLAWLTHGGTGVVSVVGHVHGQEYADMVAAVRRSDLGAALDIHRALIPSVRAIMDRSSQGVVRVKAALQLRGLLASRAVRLPLLPANDRELDLLRAVLPAAT